MRMFFVFTRKELLEQWKNFKIPILLTVLAVFGMASPILAKMMPDIFRQMDPGVTISIPESTYLDAYAQFFKNMTQTCIIIVLLIFSGNITQELQKGTAVLMFSKGLSRATFILSKFLSAALIWTVGFALSTTFCYSYTAFLFPSQTPQNLFLSMFCLWLLVLFVISVIAVTSVSFSQGYMPLLLSALVLIALLIINIFPGTTRFSPLALGTYNMELIGGTKGWSDILQPMLITVGLTGICITASIAVFRKRPL